jgi:hypothetical protein
MGLIIEELLARMGHPVNVMTLQQGTTASSPKPPHTVTRKPASDHVRDVTRLPDMLQRCSCGHITRSIEEMRHHIARARLV